MNRTEVINSYLDKVYSPKSYLEIGVRNLSNNFNAIRADIKDGVDPDPNSKCNYVMTSDEFFKLVDAKYDVVFVDGLHLQDQAYRDIVNSLKSLKKNGVLVIHDCNPPTKYHQRDHGKREWNGTVWKAFVQLRCERKDLEMFVVDADWGLGIIRPNRNQKLFKCSENIYDYDVFSKHRKEALNLISVEEFKAK